MAVCNKEILRRPEKSFSPIDIVVDLNVIIDGIFHHSEAAETIFELLDEGTCRLVSTKSIRKEFEAVATGLRIGNEWRAEVMSRGDRYFIKELFRGGLDVTEKRWTKPIRLPTGDQTDAKFVTAARRSNCECIVSLDHHLLDLPEYEGFGDLKVLTPEEFLKEFGFIS